jgi:8-oxo-dGTP pyrophosphatase MutT (NUDIX family)
VASRVERAPVYRAARTFVVDSEGRLLLLHWIDPADGIGVWFTPGGGIDDGESPVDAARRELEEETGVAVSSDRVGPYVMHLHVRSPRVWRDEHHFLVRHDGPLGRPSRPDPGTDGHRWWTLAELEASSERFHPRNVAQVLRLVVESELVEPLSVQYELE